MKTTGVKRIFTAAALAVFLAAIFPVPAAAAGEIPRVVVEDASHDFGTVFEGRVVVYGFTLKNTGGAPLAIEDVRTG